MVFNTILILNLITLSFYPSSLYFHLLMVESEIFVLSFTDFKCIIFCEFFFFHTFFVDSTVLSRQKFLTWLLLFRPLKVQNKFV